MLRIRNNTHYDTRVMRRIITAAKRAWVRAEGRAPRGWDRTVFEIVYARSRGCNGYAEVGGAYVRLRLPKYDPDSPWLEDDAWQFAMLAWHEIGHLYGYEHGQYDNYPQPDITARVLKEAGLEPGRPPLPQKDSPYGRIAAIPNPDSRWFWWFQPKDGTKPTLLAPGADIVSKDTTVGAWGWLIFRERPGRTYHVFVRDYNRKPLPCAS